jgi:hypothetical protein
MAKNTRQAAAPSIRVTKNSIYEDAKSYYNQAQELEKSDDKDQEKIDAHWSIAALHLWKALVLGHLQAPYYLSVCFNQGVGVKRDEYIAKLLFGVALELGDEKCESDSNKQIVPRLMNGAVTALTQLIRDTNSITAEDKNIHVGELCAQIEIFNQFIKLPHLSADQTIFGLFNGQNNKAAQDADYSQTQDQGTEHVADQQDIVVAGNQQTSDDNNCCCVIF